MSVSLSRPANGSPNPPFPVRGRSNHRKRSSSLCALDDLSLPSPPLSPSVSINFSRSANATGEIPIIFEFLTTSSMPSEERVSKMASLKPELPPLAKFSPMSAFFPMSDSSGTLNTISTEAFGTRRRGSHYSDTSQRRCSMLSDGSAVYSPLSADFGMPSPTEAVNHQAQPNPISENVMPTSVSMPTVCVQDYDVGHKKLGDISNFTISAYLDFPPSTSLKSLKIGFDKLEAEKRPVPTQGLLSAPTTPDVDDKTPTQSTFLKGLQASGKEVIPSSDTGVDYTNGVVSLEADSPAAEHPSPTTGNTSLTAPFSPDFDDKTPTQATFLKQEYHPVTTTEAVAVSPGSTQASPPGSLIVPSSPDPDDKTPTQATFLKRQSQSPTRCIASVGMSSEKPLPAEPIEDEASDTKSIASSTSYVSIQPNTIPSNPLPVPCLKHAQWLRDTVVELWVDQEGFRAIRPKFFLASVSNGLPYSHIASHGPPPPGTLELTEEHDPLYTTVAEFLPVSRAAHYFHHAPFDRAPTLHRITTGDESKDYISRAATIGLRENGVFFVHGTEDHRIDGDRPLSFVSTSSSSSYSHAYSSSNSSNPPGGRIVRLNWRFEYFVSSRRPDGRSAHRGEKLITPLSFSCTPALLNRTRANKVTVLHIMKKTLLPKLVAQKLEPPDLPMLDGAEKMDAQTQTRVSTSVNSLATLVSAGERTQADGNEDVSPTKNARTHNRRSGSESTSTSEQGVLPATSLAPPAKVPTAVAPPSTTASKRPFNPPRLNTPPRPPLPYTKHRRGSHSDTTPEDYMRQRQRDPSCGSGVPTGGGGGTHGTHERSRSACSFVRGSYSGSSSGTRDTCQVPQQHFPPVAFRNQPNPRGAGGGAFAGGIFGPIIPQEELMKMLDKSESRSATTSAAASADAGARRPHSIRVEVVNNVPMTTLPAAPRHKHHP